MRQLVAAKTLQIIDVATVGKLLLNRFLWYGLPQLNWPSIDSILVALGRSTFAA